MLPFCRCTVIGLMLLGPCAVADIGTISDIQVPPPQGKKFTWGRDRRNDAGVVIMQGKILFEIRRPAGGFTTTERAEIVAGRLNRLYPRLDPQDVRVGRMNNEIVVKARAPRIHPDGYSSQVRDDFLLVTCDPRTAKDLGRTRWLLAHWWRDVFRDYMLIDRGQAPAYVGEYVPTIRRYQRARARLGDETAAMDSLEAPEREELRSLYKAPAAQYAPAEADIER